MFNENLKSLRKAKGYTQEELAVRINVVRQTVSKWEKGLSIPDAEMLIQIADVLDVDVSELLGAEIKTEENRNEVAEQLAKIAEQMAVKNRRTSKIWKTVGLILGILAACLAVCIILFYMFSFSSYNSRRESGVEELGVQESGIECLDDTWTDEYCHTEMV